jgi:hypothetical protein
MPLALAHPLSLLLMLMLLSLCCGCSLSGEDFAATLVQQCAGWSIVGAAPVPLHRARYSAPAVAAVSDGSMQRCSLLVQLLLLLPGDAENDRPHAD